MRSAKELLVGYGFTPLTGGMFLLGLFGLSSALAQDPKAPGVSMTRPDEVLATHYSRYGHGSTFVELPDGRILHACGTSFMTSSDRGLTWSKSFKKNDTSGEPVGGGGSCLVKLSDRGIGLAAMRQDSKAKTPAERVWSNHIVFWRSEDGGETWQPPVRVSPMGLASFCLQDVALRTSTGRIVLPVYVAFGQRIGPDNQAIPVEGRLVNNQFVSTGAHFHDPRFLAVYVLYSDDDGRTWKRNQDDLLYILNDWNSNFDRVAEPSVAEVAPGRLLMILRTGNGRLYQAWSENNGETWTRPSPTSLAATETPAQIRRLPNGHLLIVWNQESEEEVRKGFNRTRISAAISRNGGGIWEFFQNISSMLPGTRVEPGPIHPVRPEQVYVSPGKSARVRDGSFLGDSDCWIRTSYPSVFVMSDRVLVAYTYSTYLEDPVKGQLTSSGDQPGGFNQILKVLPIRWFYGGKEPAENPTLQELYQPAKP
ncbi:MAG: sialidase family protein [Acidobacteriota bacterium]